MILSTKPGIVLALSAFAIIGLCAAPVAQAAPASKITHAQKVTAHTVYACKNCKAFYSSAMAKKMGFKDGMGHTLVKVSKAPAGYMDGSKMKM